MIMRKKGRKRKWGCKKIATPSCLNSIIAENHYGATT
jgi:hypothetical protein